MTHINELERSLSAHLDLNKSRIGCLTRMILAIIADCRVNLVDMIMPAYLGTVRRRQCRAIAACSDS